jgi:hypothetical protein
LALGGLSATIVAPGHNRVVSLPPEFIAPQDGSEKQDCESRAARLRQPICEAVRAAGGHFLFVCKPSSYKILYEWLAGIELPKRVVPVKRGKARFTHTYR